MIERVYSTQWIGHDAETVIMMTTWSQSFRLDLFDSETGVYCVCILPELCPLS